MEIGIDLVQIAEFKKTFQNEIAIKKVFSEDELKANSNTASLAGVFAVKEAFIKALGRKIDWLDIRIEKKSSGRPIVYSPYLKNNRACVSISHSGAYAVAAVIIE
jgi:holo-[acyl-carrier protein] synthase